MLPATATVTAVTGWVLIAACFIFIGHAVDYMLHFFHVHCGPASVVLRCVHLMDAHAAEDEGVFWGLTLCCAVLQAAAAVLAMLLPPRRRRLRNGLECVALAVTVIGHVLYGNVVGLVISADKGYVFYIISRTGFLVVLAVGDVVSYCTLIAVGGEEEEEEAEAEQAAAEAAGQGQQLPN